MIHLNIGSNLKSKYGSKFDNISLAIKLLIFHECKIKKISSFYETPSYPNQDLPKFVNIGVLVKFDSSEKNLLKMISKIEKKIGRLKTKKNAPRVCDIDIIDFKGLIKNDKNLIIPHPRLHMRNFVLYPIKEMDPKWIHPVFNKKIDVLINELTQNSRIEITRLNKSVII